MNEHDVRMLVREAIERHLGRPHGATKVAPYSSEIEATRRESETTRRESETTGRESETTGRARLQSSHGHASHILLKVLPGSEVDEGMCVIEPAVRCNHCGFCQSYGH